MMKKNHIFFAVAAMGVVFFLSFSNAAFLKTAGQEKDEKTFTVFMMRGKIQNAYTREWLRPLSKFSSKDKLMFSAPTDRLGLVDQQQKSYIAKPASRLPGYHLKAIRGVWNTRPGKINSYFDFRQYLDGKDFLILGDSVSIEVGRKEFPMDSRRFFIIQYHWKKEVINKRLDHSGNRLIIKRDKLYQVDGQAIEASEVDDYAFYYYNDSIPESKRINRFTPIFPQKDSLLKEVQTLLKIVDDAPRDTLQKMVENYLFEAYGVPEKNNLAWWMDTHLDALIDKRNQAQDK
ncbi:MAG: hypothetical protein AAF990_14040 [Bacteroidota bacterium]